MEGEFDVTGKTFLVTGGDKGLGLETIRRLLLGGGRVVLACRDSKYFGGQAEEETVSLCSSIGCDRSRLSILRLDLSSLASVRDFCSEVKSRIPSLGKFFCVLLLHHLSLPDVIVCNAGVMSYQEAHHNVTEDGLELHFAVNYLGHFYLVQQLKNLLLRSAEARVVLVSSILLKDGQVETDRLGAPDDGRPGGGRTPQAYADSKLMLAMFARELQRREDGLAVFCVSPGWCRTSLGRSANIPCYSYPALAILMLIFGKTVKEGADSIVFCAAKPGLTHLRGKFVRDRKIESSVENFLDHLILKTVILWQESSKVLTKITQSESN